LGGELPVRAGLLGLAALICACASLQADSDSRRHNEALSDRNGTEEPKERAQQPVRSQGDLIVLRETIRAASPFFANDA